MKVEISVERARLLVNHQLRHFEAAKISGDQHAAWRSLEHIHILSQGFGLMHPYSHWWMLRYAWTLRDKKEVVGQLMRLALAPIGNLTGRLPFGNTGRANVNAFQPMDIPSDLGAKITKL